MANKKIQIKNTAGDNLFPVTKKQCIDDFAHAHSFTGNSITPSGTITLSRSANVALSTTSIGQITGVGSLPTRSSFTYNTLTVSGSTLCVASASAYQITGVGTLPEKAPVSVATGVQTQPNFTATFSGDAVTPTGTVGGVQDDPEDPKVHVNTGTFDPTSDDPAGQKSTAEALVSKDEYYATYALYRFADTTFMHQYEFNVAIKNFLSATRIDGMFANARFVWKNNALIIPSFKNRIDSSFRAFSFASDSNCFSLTFRDNAFNGHAFFQNAVSLTSIAVADGADVKIFGYADYCFAGCTKLVEIGAFDLSEVTNLNGAFTYNNNLKHIHLKNIPVSFNISASTQFEEADLVEIIGNLVDLTGKTSQTLTMGETNLAKLTDAEKAVATNKNWILA